MLEAPAPAKLNLGLHVLRRRRDGFHDLDTVFVRIPWSDRIEVETAPGISMTCSDPSLPVDEGNLCMRAAVLLSRRSGCGTGARIHLDKRVPYGAGLGSGSSDAATTLRLLTRLWAVSMSALDLRELALELGSDVPFFLGPPVARGEGRGEVLTPIPPPRSLMESIILVAVPPVAVATSWAFGLVQPSESGRQDIVSIIASGSPESWRGRLINDFQSSITRSEAAIDAALNTLDVGGADYCSLSGSGSAVFGLFREPESALRARRALEALSCRTWVGRPGDPPAAP